MWSGPKKILNFTPTPKIAPKGPKSAKKAPNVAEFKTKKYRAVLWKAKLIVYIGRIKKVSEHEPNPNNNSEGRIKSKNIVL